MGQDEIYCYMSQNPKRSRYRIPLYWWWISDKTLWIADSCVDFDLAYREILDNKNLNWWACFNTNGRRYKRHKNTISDCSYGFEVVSKMHQKFNSHCHKSILMLGILALRQGGTHMLKQLNAPMRTHVWKEFLNME